MQRAEEEGVRSLLSVPVVRRSVEQQPASRRRASGRGRSRGRSGFLELPLVPLSLALGEMDIILPGSPCSVSGCVAFSRLGRQWKPVCSYVSWRLFHYEFHTFSSFWRCSRFSHIKNIFLRTPWHLAPTCSVLCFLRSTGMRIFWETSSGPFPHAALCLVRQRSRCSGLRFDGAGRHQVFEGEKNVALSCSFNFNTL